MIGISTHRKWLDGHEIANSQAINCLHDILIDSNLSNFAGIASIMLSIICGFVITVLIVVIYYL